MKSEQALSLAMAEAAAERALTLARPGSCRDCKHWGASEDSSFNNGFGGAERRQCVLINTKAVPSVCDLPKVGLESGDYANSDAKLWVAPDFGCVLFETKEAT